MNTFSMPGAERRTPRSPRLRHGQRLTQPEFHRRYEQCPDHFKAELIGGIVYVASSLRRRHGTHNPELTGALWLYKGGTPSVEILENTTTILGPLSEPQPDLGLRILPEGAVSPAPIRMITSWAARSSYPKFRRRLAASISIRRKKTTSRPASLSTWSGASRSGSCTGSTSLQES